MIDGLGLDDAYGETLSRIKGQGEEEARLGMATLMWISHSERPLKVDELCQALGVEIGSPDLDSDDVPSIGTLLACCQGLVIVDKMASTVRLIHFTLQEYLRAHPELFGSAHSAMAETCLSYLNSHQVKALSGDPYSFRLPPFLKYCSLYWGVHANRDLSDCAKLLALKLFDDYSNHISSKILVEIEKPPNMAWGLEGPSRFSGLHCASFFGIVDIVAGLVEMEGCDINQTDLTGRAPIAWAALSGHEGVVKMLLERDDVIPSTAENGQTPLWYAACTGQEDMMKMLLERDDVNPDQLGDYWQTPLSGAAGRGHEGVVKLLLERDDVNPDKRDDYGRTPLWRAAWNGHEGVVKLLLERGGVKPGRVDGYGRTLLHDVAERGHEGVVKILLGRDDVNPDEPDRRGRTPLWYAACTGREGVVKMLLERDDVNPNKPDHNGRTPLLCATLLGHTAVIALLEPPTSATSSTA